MQPSKRRSRPHDPVAFRDQVPVNVPVPVPENARIGFEMVRSRPGARRR